MRGSLGEKIGEGAFADVHAWAPGQIVKLFKAGVPRWVSRHEARMIRAVFAAGAPAPEVLDEVTLEGRVGIVLTRLDGPTLLQLSRSGALTFEQTGAILASLYLSDHKTPLPPDVLWPAGEWHSRSAPSSGNTWRSGTCVSCQRRKSRSRPTRSNRESRETGTTKAGTPQMSHSGNPALRRPPIYIWACRWPVRAIHAGNRLGR